MLPSIELARVKRLGFRGLEAAVLVPPTVKVLLTKSELLTDLGNGGIRDVTRRPLLI
jgi:hypothetical protein